MDEFMPRKLDILLTGVGGQGVVLAGDIIGDVAVAAGYDVKKSDTLGMAQRGGSVVAHIRMAEDVASPLIPQGQADILLSFEKMEAARQVEYLHQGGVIVFNDQAVPPLSVSREEAAYPDDERIMLALTSHTLEIYPIRGESLAAGLGNPKTLNILMLGAASMFMPFAPDEWKKAIAGHLPEKLVELNLEAFEAGRKEVMRVMLETAAEEERQAIEDAHEHGGDCCCG